MKSKDDKSETAAKKHRWSSRRAFASSGSNTTDKWPAPTESQCSEKESLLSRKSGVPNEIYPSARSAEESRYSPERDKFNFSLFSFVAKGVPWSAEQQPSVSYLIIKRSNRIWGAINDKRTCSVGDVDASSRRATNGHFTRSVSGRLKQVNRGN